jgi:peptidoglycan/LPS O-acetylase OafA/YrhL
VVLVHAHEHLGKPFPAPMVDVLERFPGVPIFFVVSGFLVSASYERSDRLAAYARNRFLRIYPGLWVCFAVSLASVTALYRWQASLGGFLAWVLAQVTVGQAYNPQFLRGYGVGVLNGSLWTIPVEIQFYLLLPLFYALLDRVRWNRAIVGIIGAALVCAQLWYAWLKGHDPTITVKLLGVSLLPWLYLFLAGVILQRSPAITERWFRGRAGYWLVAYACASALLGLAGMPVTGNLLNPVCALLLGFLTVSAALTPIARSDTWLRGNDISYGIYIYHMVLVNAFVRLGYVGGFVEVIALTGLTSVIALVSWRVVEAPALRLKTYTVREQTVRQTL